jgi:DNA-binding NarL/FixJ family response regulator
MAVTVLLVDDHDLIREGLRRAFEREGDFTVVGDVGSVSAALSAFQALSPDVVIMDIRLSDGNGLDATRSLRATSATVGIVVVSMYGEDEQLLAALDAGASAFVPKSAPVDQVVSAARHAAAAPAHFSAADLPGALRRRSADPRQRLTSREIELLQHLQEGRTAAAIAKRMYISESTVKTHISSIYDKLGATNRAQALMIAVRTGLLRGDSAGP